MKIIDRYIGFGVLFSTLFGVVVLSLVLVLGNIFKELLDLLINRDVPLGSVLAFMLYVLPFSLTFTIPWGFLTALLLVFGRLSADNELIALRCNGVSIQRIAAPVFLLAALLSALCLVINLEIAPRAETRMSQAIFDMATSRPASLFAADEIITDFPDRRIYVGNKEDDGSLSQIFLVEMDNDHNPLRIIQARAGELTYDEDGRQLLLRLHQAHFEQRDAEFPQDLNRMQRGIEIREGVFPISLESLYSEHTRGKRVSAHTIGELFERAADPALSSGDLLRTQVEIGRRFSTSLACLAFALIAIPLGITAHRRETSVGFALSLAIAFTYFFFIIMAETFSTDPRFFPAFLIWVPNILFLGLGSWLFARLMRQ
jgi:lipopolysaccharide export system permease protein